MIDLRVFLVGLGLLAAPLAGAEKKNETPSCFEVPQYQGNHAVPPVTMQIFPSSSGTVLNDAEAPPGQGDLVVVGYWEHGDDYAPGPGDNPCTGEPTFKIAYPVSQQPGECFAWKRWQEGRRGLRSSGHSASGLSCENGELRFEQWPSLECAAGNPAGVKGERKRASATKCCRDLPSANYSQVLSGCGNTVPPDLREVEQLAPSMLRGADGN